MKNESSPTFKLGLAHSHGAVWSLEWCPDGCFQPAFSRLGLLAAGFSDGKVLVYSIPSRPISTKRFVILFEVDFILYLIIIIISKKFQYYHFKKRVLLYLRIIYLGFLSIGFLK